MAERTSFNINAELYENSFGELAIRFPGEKVYRNVGTEEGARFQVDSIHMLEEHAHPPGWAEMPPHELLYKEDWHCIAMLGYIGGEVDRPAIEFEVDPQQMTPQARDYLADALIRP